MHLLMSEIEGQMDGQIDITKDTHMENLMRVISLDLLPTTSSDN